MIDNPDAPPSAETSSNPNEQAVPTALLAVDGVEPQPGDPVEFTVKGTVTRSAGGKTVIAPTEINGQPLPEMPHGEPDEDEAMRAMAEDADSDD